MTTRALRTGQVARAAGVNVETLRCDERRGILKEPRRRPSGYREYPSETVQVVRFTRGAEVGRAENWTCVSFVYGELLRDAEVTRIAMFGGSTAVQWRIPMVLSGGRRRDWSFTVTQTWADGRVVAEDYRYPDLLVQAVVESRRRRVRAADRRALNDNAERAPDAAA